MKYGSVGFAGEAGLFVALSFNSGWERMDGSFGGSICEVSTKRQISRLYNHYCKEAPHARTNTF